VHNENSIQWFPVKRHIVTASSSLPHVADFNGIRHGWDLRDPQSPKTSLRPEKRRSRQCVKHYFTSEIGGAHGVLAANSCSRISAHPSVSG
jgi:hypothetical protein